VLDYLTKDNIFVNYMDFTALFTTNGLITLLTLTVMEVVLGIDNVIFISILTGKLPRESQGKARAIGLSMALVFRVLLLFTITWIMGLTDGLLNLEDLGLPWSFDITGKDLILFGGGVFLVYKSVAEIMEHFEDEHEEDEEDNSNTKLSIPSAVVQIIFIDIVFSFDSILAAVGMSQNLVIMVCAVIIALFIMLTFSGKISDFVNENPTIKMLALCFLVLIGCLLLAEAGHIHPDKSYVYVAIGFAMAVEFLNMAARRAEEKREAKKNEHDAE
jgi:predicted tellurium resistance membrane protein TerC